MQEPGQYPNRLWQSEFGKVWYDEGAIANIFSIQDLKKQHHITYDSEIEDAFIVHKEEKEPVKFKCTSQGIYAYTITVCHVDKLDLAESHLVDTVKENHKGYTQAQFDRAVKARSLEQPPWKTTRDL